MDAKKKERTLFNAHSNISIQLTRIESEILELFSIKSGYPVSNETTTRHIGKDPDKYRGICMCFCRLQKKFRIYTSGEKLFRSVRNKGYYLVQIVEIENLLQP